MTTYIAIAIAVVLFAIVFATGFVLRSVDKPYPIPQLTIHKLISLAAVAFLGIAIYKVNQDGALGDFVWIAFAAMALFFIVAVATGGLLSGEKEWPGSIKTLHKVAPWFTIASAVAMVYLLVI